VSNGHNHLFYAWGKSRKLSKKLSAARLPGPPIGESPRRYPLYYLDESPAL